MPGIEVKKLKCIHVIYIFIIIPSMYILCVADVVWNGLQMVEVNVHNV